MAGKVQADTKQAPTKPLKGMAGLTLGAILAALPSLTKQDLKTLQAAVDRELLRDVDIDTDLFYMVFDVAGEKPMSVSKFSNSENGTIWRKNQPVFDAFITTHILQGGAAHRTIMTAIKKFLIQLIVEDIKEFKMPLTLRTVCQQLGHIHAIFEKQFPGYLKNGLGHLILEQLRGK